MGNWRSKAAAAIALAAALEPAGAWARRPLAPSGHIGPRLAALSAKDAGASSGTWTPLAKPFPGSTPDTALLLTDGGVLMHDGCTPNWYRLTPDASGDYVNGTWTPVAPMPDGYAPLYFASQVLADGQLIVNGGEYDNCSPVWTAKGALYDPVRDVWTSVAPPPGWTSIGDAQSAVLPDGRYMLASALTTDEAVAVISGTSVSWSPVGAGKADLNDEEGWTLLPHGQILTVDTQRDAQAHVSDSEIFTIATGTWSNGTRTRSRLVDPQAEEIGPAVLMPNGKVFQAGAASCVQPYCVGHTGLYTALTGAWAAGPDFPAVDGQNMDVSDGPAALLPNGHVLVQTSPSAGFAYNSPSHFFEYDGADLTRVAEPASAPAIASYEGRMLLLPTGQVLWSSDIGDVEIYSPQGQPRADWSPTISSAPATVARGGAGYVVAGTLFNGLSQGSGYGDDAQSATNYPLVRIVNDKSRRVCFARTHDHSAMGISLKGAPTSTRFDVPASSPGPGVNACDPGPGKLQVIVNGSASRPVPLVVQ
jgi:hypothetical protein